MIDTGYGYRRPVGVKIWSDWQVLKTAAKRESPRRVRGRSDGYPHFVRIVAAGATLLRREQGGRLSPTTYTVAAPPPRSPRPFIPPGAGYLAGHRRRPCNRLNRPVDRSMPGGLPKGDPGRSGETTQALDRANEVSEGSAQRVATGRAGEGFGGGAVDTDSPDSTPTYHRSGTMYLYPESGTSDQSSRYSGPLLSPSSS